MSEEQLQEENKKILQLLDTLQEYARAMSSLQSSIVDGYLEEAQTARRSTGIVCPELLISPSQETRRLFTTQSEVGTNPNHYVVLGVTDTCLTNIQTEFEKCLHYIVNIAKIKLQLRDLCQNFDVDN
ncbi:hypothetical protein GPJ56_007255 [Histomonas meleagridis]|uniref:uncharacterized protein n=1 Tax=Histomonas meleagridis TaxID=135588 RepID=UPI0035597F61|nr:hypothetical protein GPJ56_007255 [Histomonas meleagridis]KAH0804101.1 hypothetical protein GO595_002931 [Histomonas meleagridis]